ncbi:Putative GATA zinc finger [[Torrubiella] hemipterigena]|uniref:Putative GATA zinc finger n=1 Tax=[Torrubiella] hemipterigena TaxID=1531966 RepID=A0A0A1T1P4_9HYPO|nr:Putative GATA zinc finger [[Torrubiella] hemipterigena]
MSVSSTSDVESNPSPVHAGNDTMSDHHHRHSSHYHPAIHRPQQSTVTHLQPGESLETIRCLVQDVAKFKGNVGRLTDGLHASNSRHRNFTQDGNGRRPDTTSAALNGSQRHRERDSSRKSPLSRHHSVNEKASPRLGRAGFRNSQVACHSCNRINSPEWRHGPDGPGTLCNVCGLVYAKRQSHRKQQHKDHRKQ